MVRKPTYGNQYIDKAYEKFFKHEHVTYEEFVMMLATNDELYFMYDGKDYQIEHTAPNVVHMCVSIVENGKSVLIGAEKFNSIIDLLANYKVDGKTLYEIWPAVKI